MNTDHLDNLTQLLCIELLNFQEIFKFYFIRKFILFKKQKLVAEGKIKKDKHESVIFRRDNSHYEKRGSEEVCIDEEIPFEAPSSWALIRLNDIKLKRFYRTEPSSLSTV